MGQELPYEVIRRDDGAIALSVNAGFIAFTPERVERIGKDFHVCGNTPTQIVVFAGLPQDVRDCTELDGRLRLFEFAATGLHRSSWLPLSNASKEMTV